MTASLIHETPPRYTGLSTDDKPKPRNGATFAELDTGHQFIADGTRWSVLQQEVGFAGGALGAFGEVVVAAKTPQVQVKFTYNLNTAVMQSCANKAGSSVTVGSGLCIVTAGAVAESFAQMRTIHRIRYAPGQGALMQGTCAFTTGAALSSQLLLAGEDDEGFAFGFNGAAFSILRRSSGSKELRSLDITGAADAGGGDFVITLDGTAVTVSVNANDTISEVVAAIVAKASDFLAAGNGWDVHTPDNITVHFTSFRAEPAAGVFSFADTDSGVTADTFEQATTTILGVVPTDSWVAQTAWNRDVMDGTGPSGMTLDPTKLNVYSIQYQYLGGGSVEYSVEIPSGRFVLVHVIEYAGTAVVPVIENPTLRLSLIAKTETGYAGAALVMKSGSLAGFIEGPESIAGVREAVDNAKSTTGSTEVVILLLSNPLNHQGSNNKISAFPDFITLASEAGKTVTFRIRKNPTQVDGTVALASVNAVESVMKWDTAGTTVVGGDQILVTTISGADSKEVSLKDLNLEMSPGDRWAFTASLSSGSEAPVSVGASWLERI